MGIFSGDVDLAVELGISSSVPILVEGAYRAAVRVSS